VDERLGWRRVAGWTIAFCLHRTMVLWFGFNGAFYWEETYRLLMAEALSQHWQWPLLDVQADPYAGGSLVFAALAAPFVALLGPSLMGLKMMAILWSALGFVAWTTLVDRYFGLWPAFVFAFLFVFGPPLFIVYNLIAMGSHAEVMTLAGIQIWLAYRYLYDETHSRAGLFLWAAVAGVGTWFTYTAALPFAACLLIALVAGVLPPRQWPVPAAGFLLGFAPWIVTNVANGAQGLDVLTRTFGLDGSAAAAGSATYVQTVRYLVTKGIPLGLRFPELTITLPGEDHVRPLVLGQAYCVLAALGAIALAVARLLRTGVGFRVRRLAATCPEAPLLVMFPLFVLVLGATDHIFLVIDRVPFFAFRLMVPFLPALMAVIAIAVGRLPTWPRAALLILLGCLGGAGTFQVLAAGASERPRLSADARALGAEAAGHLLYYKHGADLPRLTERIDAMPEELRSAAFQGVGFSVAAHYPATEPVAGFVTQLRDVPAAYRSDAVGGARLALGPGMAQVLPRTPSAQTDALRAALDDLDPPKPGQ